MAVLLRETEIAIRKTGVADEFLESAPLVALPIGVVEIFLEDKDGARLQPRRQRPLVRALMQNDIARHVGQAATAIEFASLPKNAGPRFSPSLETVEAVE